MNVLPANPFNFQVNEMMDFEGHAILNRIWYRGDGNELEQIYQQNAEFADKHKFWASRSTPGMDMRKIHTGLPGLTVKVLSFAVLPDMNEFEFEQPAQEQLWKEIEEDNKFYKKIESALKETLFIGDGAFKVAIDTTISEYPILEWYPGERVEFVYQRDRIREIVFKTPYKEKGKVYVLNERLLLSGGAHAHQTPIAAMTAVKKYALLSLCGLTLFCARAQMPATNYDESQVPAYTLPDPLTTIAGKKVTDAETWTSERRPELLSLFESEVYGKAPGRPEGLHFEVLSEDRYTLGNMATRREIAVYFTESDAHFMTILLYIPNKRTDAVPVFLGLNFKGNHTICDDPLVTESVSRIKPREEGGSEVRAKGFPRAAAASRWPVEMLIANGYGLATLYRGDIDPDYDDGFQNGVHPLFYREGQTKPAPDEWGTIAAWAWGLSRAMDYLETDEDVDASRVAVIGHSRHGKTALWAAAVDPRFAMAVSNDSGCGGAALSRRCYGETVARINSLFPHWFCGNFKQYSGNEAALPVDQHELIALIAPRPVYIASAVEDRWADPKGEFLAGVHATPVYELFGLEGLSGTELPQTDAPVLSGHIGHHVRSGDHDITLYDWRQFVKFADKHLKR